MRCLKALTYKYSRNLINLISPELNALNIESNINVNLDIIKVLSPTDAQENCFKRSIKMFTLTLILLMWRIG